MKDILKNLKFDVITALVILVLTIFVSHAYAEKKQGSKKSKLPQSLTPKESIMKNMETIGEYFNEINGRLPIMNGTNADIRKAGEVSPGSGKRLPDPKKSNNKAEILERPSRGSLEAKHPAGYFNGKRDPFAVTNRLLKVRLGESSGALSFQPAKPGANFPVMKLRGIVRRPGKKIAALLEVEGAGTHVVREEDTVGLNELGKDAVVRIKKINRLNLVVEVGSLGQVMIVR